MTLFEKNDRIGGLLRYGIPSEIAARYAFVLQDEQQNTLAGSK